MGTGPSVAEHFKATRPQDYQGKAVIITGGSSGIGLETARVLSKICGMKVIIAVRNVKKGQDCVTALGDGSPGSIEVMELNLESFDSVKKFADNFLALNIPLHVLLLNAGIYNGTGCTQDGYEKVLQVCHFSHFLLARLLEKKLIESAPSRVIIVGSEAHYIGKAFDFPDPSKNHKGWGLDDPNNVNRTTGMTDYGRAKRANALQAASLSKRLGDKGVTAYALHPGGVNTNISGLQGTGKTFLGMIMSNVETGSKTSTYLCLAPTAELGKDFSYWVPGYGYFPKKQHFSHKDEERLWSESEKVVAKYLN